MIADKKKIRYLALYLKFILKILLCIVLAAIGIKIIDTLIKFGREDSDYFLGNLSIKHILFDQNKKLVVLIYGTFYGAPMSSQLVDGLCQNTPSYKIVRAETCVPHDIVILYFTHYDRFMANCLKSPHTMKKVIIISSLEPAWYTKTEMHVQPFHKDNYHLLSESFHQESVVRITYFAFQEKKSSIDPNELVEEFKNRRHSVGAIISKCLTPVTVRLEYVLELEKYFDVEKYGDCFVKKISGEESAQVMKKVMFYISFENSVCDDYITEKYCRPIKYGAIPIVMSPPNNVPQLIPGSFINVFDFKSVKHLAEHLGEIAQDFSKYQSYFAWKQNFRLSSCDWSFSACEMIYQASKILFSGKSIEDAEKTLLSERNCITLPQIRQKLLRGN